MTDRQKQNLLQYLGYYTGAIDGIWGSQSQKATADFQYAFGLDPDGVCGVQTQKALTHAVDYGMPVMEEEEPQTGTFWDEIEYFTEGEFACKCGLYHEPYCDGYPARMQEGAVRIADQIRRHFGVPADIISGLRCRQHNADSGGASNSQHMYGEAVDIHVRGVPGQTVLAYVLTLPGVRYAYQIAGSENVHFDIPKGER